MTTKKDSTRDPKLFSRNPLTPEGAGLLADSLAHFAHYDADAVASVLLLMHALTYEPDMTTRENMHSAAQVRLAVYVEGHGEAEEKAMRRQLDALKGGAR
jgi:hypothetical protein